MILKLFQYVILFVREYNKLSIIMLTTSKETETLVKLGKLYIYSKVVKL